MHQSIEERMFVSQQRLWGVKLDHSPSIHDKNTITIHNGIEPKTRKIALIIWKELTQRLFLSNEYQPPEVREFVLLSVFPLIETICPKIWAKLLPNNAKRSTSGGFASTAPQKRLFAWAP